MKKLLPRILILGLIITTHAAAQPGSANNDTIASFQTMHVHFDKDIYLPGETIWFKAYLYNVNEISLAATNFYVAIYNEQGKLIQQKQYPILSGSANGDFEVPDSLSDSRIRFRAFTKAMILNDSSNIYERILDVYTKDSQLVSPGSTNTEQTVRFFPEGGQIIASLQNYIGVKAANADGSPAGIKGKVVETGQKKLYSDFSTNNLGLGQFIFAPAPGKNYTAIWTDIKGSTHETALPAIKNNGVVLHAEVAGKELQYSLSRNVTNDSVSMLHLIAQMGNYKLYQADLVLVNEMDYSVAGFSIDSFPSGLMQITVFDKYWNKLQERNVFINEQELYAVPVIHTDSVKFGSREKSMIEIVLSDTVFSSLSVSVTDVNFHNPAGIHTITHDLVLNTQIKNPGQDMEHFLKAGNSEMINLFTLNHEWRKYKRENLVNGSNVKPEVLDDYIAVSASYNSKGPSLPKDDALNLILYNSVIGKEFYNIKTSDATGFRKTGLILFDSAKLAYQMDKNKKLTDWLRVYKEEPIKIPVSVNALQIDPLKETAGAVGKNSFFKTFINTTARFNDAHVLKEVIVKTAYKNRYRDRMEELDKKYATGMFAGGTRGYQLNVIDDTLGSISNSSLKDYLRYRCPGLEMDKAGRLGKWRDAMVENQIRPVFFPTIIFLDEVEINYDISGEFEMVNMSDIAYVKYIPGIVIGASFKTTAGAIYIYNKKGNEKSPMLSKGLPFVYIKGYDFPKEYSQPDKNEPNQKDLRSTVYWNPNIILDKTNNSFKIEYYNNDVSKKLLLKIEGINAAGKLIHIERVME